MACITRFFRLTTQFTENIVETDMAAKLTSISFTKGMSSQPAVVAVLVFRGAPGPAHK